MNPLCHVIYLLLALLAVPVAAEQPVDLDGMQLMEEIYRRHRQYPFVYEQQSMVMRDRNGKRDTRKADRYSRVEADGTARFMLVFSYPEEISGVTVLATRDPSGKMTKSIYLPAFAPLLIESNSENSDGNFLGTDFSVENIVGENLADYQYVRRHDRTINNNMYFVIDVYDRDDDINSASPLRRHFVQQDNYFITLIEHYDNYGRLHKRQSYHDLRAVDGDMWRSGMILMEDIKEQHQTLLKVTRRFFSHDYVPGEMFTAEWLYENHPYHAPPDNMDEIDAEDPEDAAAVMEDRLSRLSDARSMQP